MEEKHLNYLNFEVSALSTLNHKNIIKLIDIKKTKKHYYIIFEYCNGDSLKSCLEKYKCLYNRPFTEEIVQHLMRQIISAIKYIHDLKIVHRNLKLDNIMVNFESAIDKNQLNLLKAEVKIVGFFFAGKKDNEKSLSTIVGSPKNMDPLILNQ